MSTKGLIKTTFEYKKFRNWFVIEIWGVNWTWYGLTAAHSEPVMLGLWKWLHKSGANFCSCWCVKYVWSVLVGRLAQTARRFAWEKAFFRRTKSVCVRELACLCMRVVQWTRFEGLCPKKWVSVGENAEASSSHLLEQIGWAYIPMADPRTKMFNVRTQGSDNSFEQSLPKFIIDIVDCDCVWSCF